MKRSTELEYRPDRRTIITANYFVRTHGDTTRVQAWNLNTLEATEWLWKQHVGGSYSTVLFCDAVAFGSAPVAVFGVSDAAKLCAAEVKGDVQKHGDRTNSNRFFVWNKDALHVYERAATTAAAAAAAPAPGETEAVFHSSVVVPYGRLAAAKKAYAMKIYVSGQALALRLHGGAVVLYGMEVQK